MPSEEINEHLDHNPEECRIDVILTIWESLTVPSHGPEVQHFQALLHTPTYKKQSFMHQPVLINALAKRRKYMGGGSFRASF